MKRPILLILFVVFSVFNAIAQNEYRSPLDIPLILSANFGELRPNHFHSGIDLKTQGVINKPVYSIADGFVSRISVSPSGYGLAIYIDHPSTGHTSVYGHIEKFAPKIAKYVKDKQYEKESYKIDISLDATEIPLKKGELFAYSGNTGSSGGPHVHFEIRNTSDQLALDPLVYYKSQIKDAVPPQPKGIAVYPLEGEGMVNSKESIHRESISTLKNGSFASLKDSIKVWGKVGIGIYTNDRMTGTHNIYGVKKVRLYLDNKEIFSSDISSVDFDKTRMINSLIDYDYWYRKRAFYQKSFIEPGNLLPIYKAENNGYINIDSERIYKLRYELEDLYGNQTTYEFNLIGKKQEIPFKKNCSQYFEWNEDNHFSADLFHLSIPKGNLYDNVCFTFDRKQASNSFSSVYQVNDEYIPLHGYAEMTIKLTKDSLSNKSQYGIVRINAKGGQSWVGGKYSNAALTARIRDLGHTYTVSADTKAPVITPLQPARWVTRQEIEIKVTDNLSGITSYRGTIDGEFALFEHDMKKPIYKYKFDPSRLKKGKTHKLIFTATDACGNESSYEYEFKY